MPSTQYSVYVIAVRLIGKSEILEGSRSITATAKTASTRTVQGNVLIFQFRLWYAHILKHIVYNRYSSKVTKLFNYSAVMHTVYH